MPLAVDFGVPGEGKKGEVICLGKLLRPHTRSLISRGSRYFRVKYGILIKLGRKIT